MNMEINFISFKSARISELERLTSISSEIGDQL